MLAHVPAPSLSSVVPQTYRHVFRAESYRLRRPEGMLRNAVASVVLGLGAGAALMSTMHWAAGLEGEVSVSETASYVTLSLQATLFMTAVVLSLAAVTTVARQHSSMLSTSLLLVPRRSRLVGAQLGAIAAFAVSVLLGTGILAAAGLSLWNGASSLSQIVITLVAATIAGTAMALIAAALGMLLRSAPASLIGFLTLTLVLPAAALFSDLYLPAALARVVGEIAQWMPTGLYMRATEVAGMTGMTWIGFMPLVLSAAALLAWSTALSLAACVVVNRRDP